MKIYRKINNECIRASFTAKKRLWTIFLLWFPCYGRVQFVYSHRKLGFVIKNFKKWYQICGLKIRISHCTSVWYIENNQVLTNNVCYPQHQVSSESWYVCFFLFGMHKVYIYMYPVVDAHYETRTQYIPLQKSKCYTLLTNISI